jgi:CheY-like chemotaxis protein
MISYSDLMHTLQEALAHLHDPDYAPSEGLMDIVGCDPDGGVLAVQSAIAQMIREMEPPPETPRSARSWQNHQILHNRFALKLTVEETAERLHMSTSTVRRAQRVATHELARRIWERPGQEDSVRASGAQATGIQATAVRRRTVARSQLERDLASLQVDSPEAVADIAEAVSAAVRLEQIVAAHSNVVLRVESMPPGLAAAVHPSPLRQILLMAIGELIERSAGGEIVIRAGQDCQQIIVELSSPVPPPAGEVDLDAVREMVSLHGGSTDVDQSASRLTVQIGLPAVGDVTVLVIDDNPDAVYYYRRCAAGTRYRLVHTNHARKVLEAVESYGPDVIVLDIMLPDVDGWEVLADLHNHPSTSAIPILVSSVVQEKNLALALGAQRCLHKPLSRREFVEALDWAAAQASSAVPASPPRTAPPD